MLKKMSVKVEDFYARGEHNEYNSLTSQNNYYKLLMQALKLLQMF